jgi:hypothetical protein
MRTNRLLWRAADRIATWYADVERHRWTALPDVGRAHPLRERIDRTRHQIARVVDRGWMQAAERKRRELDRALVELERWICDQRRALVPPRSAPRTSEVYAELVAAADEFDRDVQIEDTRIALVTERITLEDVPLGQFLIALDFDRYETEPSCRIEALDPNPASSDDSVTHPHVKDERLCAGDASVPIHKALIEGRLCDAFVLVRSVLQAYNPRSPYVDLDDWEGTACEDCGGLCTDACCCEACEMLVCDECIRSCVQCGTVRCRSCLETCEITDEWICDECADTCERCGRRCRTDLLECGLCEDCANDERSDDEDEATTGKGSEAPGVLTTSLAQAAVPLPQG